MLDLLNFPDVDAVPGVSIFSDSSLKRQIPITYQRMQYVYSEEEETLRFSVTGSKWFKAKSSGVFTPESGYEQISPYAWKDMETRYDKHSPWE